MPDVRLDPDLVLHHRAAAAAVRARRCSPTCASCGATRGRSACSRSGWCSPRRSASPPSRTRSSTGCRGRRRSCSAPSSAPTDPVAATAIAGRVGAPRRIVTVLEGESLINDSTALIAFKFAVAAATAGTFSLSDAAGEFVLGVARRRRDRRSSSPGSSSRSAGASTTRRRSRSSRWSAPYFAYLPADALGVSGVVAAVTTGHLRRLARAAAHRDAETRLQLYAMWDVVMFLLNSMLFVLDRAPAAERARRAARSATRRRSRSTRWRSR